MGIVAMIAAETDRRDDRRWEGRRDDHRWNEGPRHDGDWNNHRGVSPPRYADPPRYTHQPTPPRYDYRRENGRWNLGTYNRPYGYAPHYWRRGERLPGAYYGSRYVVKQLLRLWLARPALRLSLGAYRPRRCAGGNCYGPCARRDL